MNPHILGYYFTSVIEKSFNWITSCYNLLLGLCMDIDMIVYIMQLLWYAKHWVD